MIKININWCPIKLYLHENYGKIILRKTLSRIARGRELTKKIEKAFTADENSASYNNIYVKKIFMFVKEKKVFYFNV